MQTNSSPLKLNDEENRFNIYASLAQLNAALASHGVVANQAADISIEKFCAETPEKQQAFLNNLSIYSNLLNQDPETEKGPRNTEVARLKSALSAFGLQAPDKGIFDLIKEDDVIEVYSDTGIQLYRNMAFFKLCSYSLLDLSVNPWDELYEKPAAITEQILKKIGSAFTPETETLPYEIHNFIQRERFIYAKSLKTFIVSLKYISPLVDQFSGRTTGFISTFRGEILAEGKDSMKFNII